MKTEQYDGQELPYGAIVRFTAPWCNPCRVYAPIFDSVMEGRQEPAFVVDIEQHPDLAAQYNVRSIPATMRHHSPDGSNYILVGLSTREGLIQWLDGHADDNHE